MLTLSSADYDETRQLSYSLCIGEEAWQQSRYVSKQRVPANIGLQSLASKETIVDAGLNVQSTLRLMWGIG